MRRMLLFLILVSFALSQTCIKCEEVGSYTPSKLLVFATGDYKLTIFLLNATNNQPLANAPIIIHRFNSTDDFFEKVFTNQSGKAEYDFSDYKEGCFWYQIIFCSCNDTEVRDCCFEQYNIDLNKKGVPFKISEIPLAKGASQPPSAEIVYNYHTFPSSSMYSYCPPQNDALTAKSYAFCLPLAIIFALLGGALVLTGRNPLRGFDIGGARVGKHIRYDSRGRGAGYGMLSFVYTVGSIVRAVKEAGEIKEAFETGEKSGGTIKGVLSVLSLSGKKIEEQAKDRVDKIKRIGVAGSNLVNLARKWTGKEEKEGEKEEKKAPIENKSTGMTGFVVDSMKDSGKYIAQAGYQLIDSTRKNIISAATGNTYKFGGSQTGGGGTMMHREDKEKDEGGAKKGSRGQKKYGDDVIGDFLGWLVGTFGGNREKFEKGYANFLVNLKTDTQVYLAKQDTIRTQQDYEKSKSETKVQMIGPNGEKVEMVARSTNETSPVGKDIILFNGQKIHIEGRGSDEKGEFIIFSYVGDKEHKTYTARKEGETSNMYGWINDAMRSQPLEMAITVRNKEGNITFSGTLSMSNGELVILDNKRQQLQAGSNDYNKIKEYYDRGISQRPDLALSKESETIKKYNEAYSAYQQAWNAYASVLRSRAHVDDVIEYLREDTNRRISPAERQNLEKYIITSLSPVEQIIIGKENLEKWNENRENFSKVSSVEYVAQTLHTTSDRLEKEMKNKNVEEYLIAQRDALQQEIKHLSNKEDPASQRELVGLHTKLERINDALGEIKEAREQWKKTTETIINNIPNEIRQRYPDVNNLVDYLSNRAKNPYDNGIVPPTRPSSLEISAGDGYNVSLNLRTANGKITQIEYFDPRENKLYEVGKDEIKIYERSQDGEFKLMGGLLSEEKRKEKMNELNEVLRASGFEPIEVGKVYDKDDALGKYIRAQETWGKIEAVKSLEDQVGKFNKPPEPDKDNYSIRDLEDIAARFYSLYENIENVRKESSKKGKKLTTDVDSLG